MTSVTFRLRLRLWLKLQRVTHRGGGSDELRALHLSGPDIAVDWLLDPGSAVVAELSRSAAVRTATTPCDPLALAADLPDLEVLIKERHFGVATAAVPAGPVSALLDDWSRRLHRERPATWGAAIGTTFHELRWLLRDSHLSAAGEDDDLVAAVDPRGGEPRSVREPGPVVTESEHAGVLCLRIRQFGGSSRESTERTLAWQDSHRRHFDHDRILIDLRANPGGDDRYTIEWARRYLSRAVTYPPWSEWRIDDVPLNYWNGTVFWQAVQQGLALGPDFDLRRFELGGAAELAVETRTFGLPASGSPWQGRMIVLTDRGSASSAESAAWLLREGLGARLVGRNTAGCMAFGNIAPYLLPRSGLKLSLPTAASGRDAIELSGLPVDLEYDVSLPVQEVAEQFDVLHEAVPARPADLSHG